MPFHYLKLYLTLLEFEPKSEFKDNIHKQWMSNVFVAWSARHKKGNKWNYHESIDSLLTMRIILSQGFKWQNNMLRQKDKITSSIPNKSNRMVTISSSPERTYVHRMLTGLINNIKESFESQQGLILLVNFQINNGVVTPSKVFKPLISNLTPFLCLQGSLFAKIVDPWDSCWYGKFTTANLSSIYSNSYSIFCPHHLTSLLVLVPQILSRLNLKKLLR